MPPAEVVEQFTASDDYPMYIVTAVAADSGERSGCLVGFTTQCSINPHGS